MAASLEAPTSRERTCLQFNCCSITKPCTHLQLAGRLQIDPVYLAVHLDRSIAARTLLALLQIVLVLDALQSLHLQHQTG